MTSRPRALPSCRHVLAAPIAAVVLLSGAACGSDDTSAEPAPESGSSTTAASSPTPTPTETETPTTAPLSPYENDAAVKVVREWAVILGKGVPQGNLSRLSKVSTGEALSATKSGFDGDFGNEWPGPQPLTPVVVKRSGATTTVDLCYLAKGWSQDPKTHAPVSGKRLVEPARFTLEKRAGRWLITTIYSSDIDCSDIPVKGVSW